MPSVNLDLNFFRQSRTLQLVGLLGKDSELLPLRLRCHCGEHHSDDGRFTGLSADTLESIAGWRGKKGQAIAALVDSGFLVKDGDTFVLTDFDQWGGHIRKYKERARTAALAKAEKYRKVPDKPVLQAELKPPASSSPSVLQQADAKDASISGSISGSKDLTTPPAAAVPQAGQEQQRPDAEAWQRWNRLFALLRNAGWSDRQTRHFGHFIVKREPCASAARLTAILALCLHSKNATAHPDLYAKSWLLKNKPDPAADLFIRKANQLWDGWAGDDVEAPADLDALISGIFKPVPK